LKFGVQVDYDEYYSKNAKLGEKVAFAEKALKSVPRWEHLKLLQTP